MKIIKYYSIIFLSFFYLSSANSSEVDIYKKIDLFGEVLEKINREYIDEINQSESMDSAINGLLQSLDPYSSYMSPEILEEMQTETSGEFGGLGIEVSMEAGVVKVISPIDDTPASKAGLKAGDYIVKINDTQVQGKSLSEAVDLMRGPVGSSIELTVRRRGEKKALTFNITREIIEIQSVKSELLEENIGYIRLTSFNENSSDQIEKQIKDIFCRSSITLGDGRIESVRDLIIVNQNTFETSKTTEIADEVSRINKKFKKDGKYILVGPGRWGSADPWLGIPVQWNQISNAKAIIEVGMDDLPIDPSFGSHFFQNITSLHVAYLTVNPKSKNDQLLLDWIDEDCLVQSNKYTSWYRFKNPFIMTLDGTTGVGEIYQPEEEELVTMDEEESSGI